MYQNPLGEVCMQSASRLLRYHRREEEHQQTGRMKSHSSPAPPSIFLVQKGLISPDFHAMLIGVIGVSPASITYTDGEMPLLPSYVHNQQIRNLISKLGQKGFSHMYHTILIASTYEN